MLGNCLLVALGGGCGAAGRYLLGLIPVTAQFPVMTLLINLLGAAAIGFFTGMAEQDALSGRPLLCLKTGLCGGFTTFSTFSLESLSLLEKERYAAALLYMGGSVALCLLGVLLGRMAAKAVFA